MNREPSDSRADSGPLARYTKPELREYGAIADLTMAVGTSAMPDGGPPISNMSVSV